MANILFTKRIEDNIGIMGGLNNPNIKSVFNSDGTFFGYFGKFNNNYFGSNYCIFRYDETNNNIIYYNLDGFLDDYFRYLMIIKKGDNFFFLGGNQTSLTNLNYYKGTINGQKSNGVYKVEFDNTQTTAFSLYGSSIASGSGYGNGLYNNGYWVFGYAFRNKTPTYISQAVSFSITWTGDEINIITKNGTTRTFRSSSGLHTGEINLLNFNDYITIGTWNSSISNYYPYSFKLNSSTGVIESVYTLSISGFYSNVNIKNKEIGKMVRKGSTYLEYNNGDGTRTTTGILSSSLNTLEVLFYITDSTYTNQIGALLSTSSTQKLFDADSDAISGNESIISSYGGDDQFADLDNDDFIWIKFVSSGLYSLNIFTISTTKGGVECYSTGNGITNIIYLGTDTTKFSVNLVGVDNSGTKTLEYRENGGTWIDITSNLGERISITTPGSGNYIEIRITLDSNVAQTSTPELDKFISLEYKTN